MRYRLRSLLARRGHRDDERLGPLAISWADRRLRGAPSLRRHPVLPHAKGDGRPSPEPEAWQAPPTSRKTTPHLTSARKAAQGRPAGLLAAWLRSAHPLEFATSFDNAQARRQTPPTGPRADSLSPESLGESSSWGPSVPNGMARARSLRWPERNMLRPMML
jgi:hypothetical protein